MQSVKTIINFCTSILNISINLFGYDISLMMCLVFFSVLFLIVYFIFGLFK